MEFVNAQEPNLSNFFVSYSFYLKVFILQY